MLFRTLCRLGAVALLLAACDFVPRGHGDGGWPPLPPAPPPDDPRAVHYDEAAALRRRLASGAVDVDSVVWYARRLGYLAAYDAAITACDEGLRRFPDDPRLLRHRGHRFITTRRFDAAITDLARARAVMGADADDVEPDGLPNAAGRPTGTLGTAVLYHLALARYLARDFAAAADDWRACVERSPTRDMEVAARSWLVLALRRQGDAEGAAAAAAAVDPDWEILANVDYHRLCLVEAGGVAPDQLFEWADAPAASEALRYGAARYAVDHGRADGRERLRALAAAGASAAFGTIAAEADIAAGEAPR